VNKLCTYAQVAVALLLTSRAVADTEMLHQAELGVDAVVADLGSLSVGENRLHLFAVTNRLRTAMRLLKVETSCDCLTVVEYPQTIAPGKVGEVLMNVYGEKPGAFAFAAAFQLADGSQRFLVAQVVVGGQSGAPRETTPGTAAAPRVTRSRDRTLYRTLSEARDDVLEGRVRVVDLRPRAAFAQIRLPDALNMTPAVARSKGFLRRGPVLLVDEGWGCDATERVCSAIRAAGNTECSILLGGINAWVRDGARFSGLGKRVGDVTRISPREFLGVRGYDDWVVAGDVEQTRRWLPESVPVDTVVVDPWQRVLVVDAAAIPEGLTAACVYTLDGGIAALQREYRDMTAMRNSHTRTSSRRITGKRWEVIRAGCGCK
jgi:hypothetical protein